MPDTSAEVEHIVAAVAEARCRGESLSDEQVLDRHPTLREELRLALPFASVVAEAHRRSLEAGSDHDHLRVMTDDELEAPIVIPAYAGPPTLSGYDLSSEIARGGQAIVYRGTHVDSGRDVAVKVLHGGQHVSASSASRFRREVKILLRLRAPNVVRIVDHGHMLDGSQYLVMPYIDGLALDTHAAGLPGGDAAIAALFATVAEAVDAVHQAGVIHRDLKPSNVRVDADGQPHVLDFGLASSVAAADLSRSLTGPGQILGSLPWASPEQARGEVDQLDARSDVYAMGLMLCKVISTDRAPAYPVDGPPHVTIEHILRTRPKVQGRRPSDPLARVALRCLEKRPADRYESAGALAADLRRAAAGEQVTRCRRHRNYWPAGVSLVVAAAVALVALRGRSSAEPVGRTPLFRSAMVWPTRQDAAGLTYSYQPATSSARLNWTTAPISQRDFNRLMGQSGGDVSPATVDATSADAFCKVVSRIDGYPCQAKMADRAERAGKQSFQVVTEFSGVPR